MRRRTRLYIIFLQFGDDFFSEAMKYLEYLQRKVLRRVASSVLVIDNAVPKGTQNVIGGVVVYGGDNEFREFSGWQHGVEQLRNLATIADDDLLLFANDTFFRNYDPKWLKRFSASHLATASRKHVIVGWKNCFPEPMSILGYSARCWIRTNCFIISHGTLRKIEPFILQKDPGALFSGDVRTFFQDDADLEDAYKAYIRQWLFADQDNSGKRWYRSEPLTADNLPFFEKKALSIMCEHVLSARAEKSGVRLVAINTKTKKFIKNTLKRILWQNPAQ